MAAPLTQTSLAAAKAALRRDILRQRDALDESVCTAASAHITEIILGLEGYRSARCVLAYASIGHEVDTGALLLHMLGNKKLVLPKVDSATRMLQLYFVNDLERDLQPGVWGIREPRPDRCVPAPLADIDLVLAPGVAFTPRGGRLGYGAGYYDRLLARFSPRPAVIAAAYDMQVVADVPLGPTDLPVDMVVTEKALYTR